MSKKDPTTKIKALKEFTDLVNHSEPDVVNTILTFFPKIYVQLSTDVDSRVREGAQSALSAVVNKVGKSLAKILKQVFPAWVRFFSHHFFNVIFKEPFLLGLWTIRYSSSCRKHRQKLLR